MRRIALAMALAAALAAQKPDIRVDVDLVTVACSATAADGAPVKNLTAGDFLVRDNGETRKVTQFWQESDLPLTIGLVVDASGSQLELIARHRDTIGQFL
jgi:Ca-activated chloride channel family protein